MHDYGDHSYRHSTCHTASACHYHSENIPIWGQLGYYNQKQNKDFLPPSAPNLVIERETYMTYSCFAATLAHMKATLLCVH